MIVAAWVVGFLALSVALGLLIGRGIRLADEREEIRQPAVRDWVCSDGNMRTAAEAADWCAATPGSDAYWLDAWIFGETVPDYVPRSWVS